MNTLTASNSFSYQRFQLYTKRTIFLSQKLWLIGFSSVFGILALIWFIPILTDMTVWHGYQIENLFPMAVFLYIFGGLLITSSLFNELHSPTTAFLNFTLPVTAFEKLLSAWVVSTILFSIAAVTGYFLLHLLLQLSSPLFSASPPALQLFNPIDQQLSTAIQHYIFYNSVFLLGAVYFKKNTFLKTLLSIILFGVLMAFILGVVGFFHTGNIFLLTFVSKTVLDLITLGFILMMLFFSYIRLKNRQVA